jgi:extracellular elastinolytic metalloproteinase
MPLNLAASANGATATGDGVNLGALIDDTEMTNWASLGSPIAGKQVTVRLDGRETFDRIQVSAMLRHRLPTDPDGGSQSRFSALRQFELLACDARGAINCSQPSQFASVFTSAADAFPSAIPRPRVPELIIRSFDVPQTRATHVRLRVLTNQCTGAPAYQGDQDDDSRDVTDRRGQHAGRQRQGGRAAGLQMRRHRDAPGRA